MSTWVFFNKVDIVNTIIDDKVLVNELLGRAKDLKTTNAIKCELGGFLKELCQFAQTLQHVERDGFYQVLANNGILEVVENFLSSSGKENNKVLSLGGEILAYIIDWSPSFVRRHCLEIFKKNQLQTSLNKYEITSERSESGNTENNNSPPISPLDVVPPTPPKTVSNSQKSEDETKKSEKPELKTEIPEKKSEELPKKLSETNNPIVPRQRCVSSSSSTSTVVQRQRPNIITLLITQMINDTDPEQGGAVQLAALLKQLLDTDSLTSTRNEILEFMQFFYTHCIQTLVDPIYQITDRSKKRVDGNKIRFNKETGEQNSLHPQNYLNSMNRSPNNNLLNPGNNMNYGNSGYNSYGNHNYGLNTSGSAKSQQNNNNSAASQNSVIFNKSHVFETTRRLTPRLLKRIQQMSWQRANILSILLEILNFCIEHHVLEARQFLCRDDLLPRISVLARSRHLFLASTVVRVFRKLLNRSDMMYSRRINEQHSLEPILCTLEDTAENYNILQSSVLELMDQIVQNFMRDIGMNLWEEYSEKLESYHSIRKTELFTRFRDEYSKRKQQQERRTHMNRWGPGGTQSTANF